jgi:hypothetical protein
MKILIFSKIWIEILKTESSVESIVNIQSDFFHLERSVYQFSTLSISYYIINWGMLNFQNLLVHIIGLVIYRCLKKQIQVVYIFSPSNC